MVGMSWRLIFLSVLLGMTVFLVWSNYQTTGSISESVNKSWDDITSAQVVKDAQKSWQKAGRQASVTLKKLKDGRLMQEAVKFVDKISMTIFKVKTLDLQAELQKYEKTWLDGVLLFSWLLLGYVCYTLISGGVTVFIMATSLLLHSLYGPAWCMYELVVLLGLFGYALSVITNNAVFTAVLLAFFYMIYAFYRLIGWSVSTQDSDKLDRLEARVAYVQQELDDYGKQLSVIENKVDLVRSAAAKRDSK